MRVPLRIAMLMALLVAVSASSSWAVIETYLPGGANVTMKFSNFDAGTRYINLAPGTVYDDADLAALPTSDPGGGLPYKTVTGYGDDGFGTFFLTTIYDTDSLVEYYNRGMAPFEITGFFWGLDDKEVEFDGTSQFIKSTDLHFAMFEDPLKDFARGAPTDRVGVTFPTVTNGDLIWTGSSVVGSPDADPYEFFSKFTPGATPAADVGQGNFLAATGAVPVWGEGPLNWMFAEIEDGVNFKFQFTADTDGAGRWPLASNDPIKAEITPELSSGGLMLLGMLPIGVAWWRRRKA